MSHHVPINQLLLALQLLGASLEEVKCQVQHLEQHLREKGTTLVEDDKEEEAYPACPLGIDAGFSNTTSAQSALIPCRACGVSIKRTASGELLDLDGGDHAQTCSHSRVCGSHLDEPKTTRTRRRTEDQPAGTDPLAARRNSSTSAARKRIERPME